MKRVRVLTVGLAAAVLLIAGCPKSPTLEEIEAERQALPALYMTEKTLSEVQAPANQGMFVDEATGEICYPAYACQNPDCPGRNGNQPHLFIHRDVLVSVDASGEFTWSPIPNGQNPQEYIESLGGHMVPTCPKCLEVRDLASESDEDRQKYQDWAKLYELPETAARRAELEEAYQEAFEAREAIRQGE